MNILIEIIFVLLGAIIIIRHTRRGFIKTLLGFVRIVLSIASASIFTSVFFGDKGFLERALGYFLIFAATYIILTAVSILVNKFFELPILKEANKLMGFILGCLSAYLLLSTLALLIGIFAEIGFLGISHEQLQNKAVVYGFFENYGVFAVIDKYFI